MPHAPLNTAGRSATHSLLLFAKTLPLHPVPPLSTKQRAVPVWKTCSPCPGSWVLGPGSGVWGLGLGLWAWSLGLQSWVLGLESWIWTLG